MKIFHFILGKANKLRPNGVNQVIAGLVKYSVRQGCDVRVTGKAENVDFQGQVFDRDGFNVTAFSRVSPLFINSLKESIQWSDVVHLHGVYNPWNIFVAYLCKRAGKPFVLTLHDGLASERLNNRRPLLKRFFNVFIQRRHICSAAAVHVLTEEEATDLVEFGRDDGFAVINNGVDLDDFPKIMNHVKQGDRRKVRIGFLGRFSPEKNVGSLIHAFVELYGQGGSGVELLLAGPDSEYLRGLLSNCQSDQVSWVGPLYGKDKEEFICSLDLFVHPAYCDVFSIAAMEVLAIGTPLLITRTSNAAYFYNRNAFYMCEPTAIGLKGGLKLALEDRSSFGAKVIAGRGLIEDTFNWDVAATKILGMYGQVLGGGIN